MRRKLLRLLVFLVSLAALAVVAGYMVLRQSLPRTEGEIGLPGLTARVDILRDRYGVPHIFAEAEQDAHFALGFVHAQDRLWQLEMNRRVGAGRLSEVVGSSGLETDRFMRTLGVRRAAEASLLHLDADTRLHLDAYAAGINAFLAARPVLPPEFLLLRVKPEAWTPADSISWTKIMAWDLGGNWRNELLRLRLSRTLPLSRIHEFLPPYPGEAPPEIVDLRKLYEGLGEEKLVSGTDFSDSSNGSNSWVVAGARSASGKPMLANDPHLGLAAPSLWYLAHLNAPGLNAIGATLPGVPGVLIGRNDRIAWGFTNTGADVQDLYLEKLDAAGNYLTPEGPRAFTVFSETIKVKDKEDERLQVRVSRHGPVISDVMNQFAPRGYVLALAWTALAEDDLSLQAAIGLARAKNWNEFLNELKNLHSTQQTITYADVDGNIGFIAAGRVPLRKPENNLKGLAPALGWDARYDWNGYLAFEALPRAFNPSAGSLVAANHKTVPAGYRHHISFEWQPPHRARRIEELLSRDRQHTAASFARVQLDTVSLAVRELLPHLLSTKPKSDEARAALKMLATWDGTMAAARPEPLIVTAWWRELTRALYADELGDAFRAQWAPRSLFVVSVFSGKNPAWCDDVRTPRIEFCEEVLTDSLEKALTDLKARYGLNMEAWKWGEAHAAQHRHRPFWRHAWLARFFDFSVPSPGDANSINVGHSDFSDEAAPYANRRAATYRGIYDLADPQSSLFIHSGGQSGNPLSPHYRAFAEPWSRGEYIRMVTERERLEAEGAQRLVLTPQGIRGQGRN
jgi:penicillin amidase